MLKMHHAKVETAAFNPNATLPYSLRLDDFKLAMQDAYDFFFDVNTHLLSKGLERLDDMLRPALRLARRAVAAPGRARSARSPRRDEPHELVEHWLGVVACAHVAVSPDQSCTTPHNHDR